MSTPDLARFRALCGQFHWLAIFMVCSVGAVLAILILAGPIVAWQRDEPRYDLWGPEILRLSPSFFYLFAVWSIGSAMGQVAKGRLIQPILATALRRVGIALGLGGLLAVFGVTNIARLFTGHGSWAYFDVAAMTLGMIGGALFLLGRVVDQADRIQSELDEMI